jgi:hypothetical protein
MRSQLMKIERIFVELAGIRLIAIKREMIISGRTYIRPVGHFLTILTPAGDINLTAVAPDSKLLAVAVSGFVRILRLFPDWESLLAAAKSAMPRCLTAEERQQYNMGQMPPRWCITGVGHEKDDPSKWSGIWPYDNAQARSLLSAADAAHPPLESRYMVGLAFAHIGKVMQQDVKATLGWIREFWKTINRR